MTSKRAGLIDEVQTRDAESLSVKELLKEAEFMRDVDVASAIAKAIAKFKESKEVTVLLKKNYHNGYDVGVVEIFYNIWAKYRDVITRSLGVSSQPNR